jgi:hypothetical protein
VVNFKSDTEKLGSFFVAKISMLYRSSEEAKTFPLLCGGKPAGTKII